MFEQTLVFFQQFPTAFYLFVIIFSLIIGSFLNVVIYRLPKMMHNNWYLECREFLADEVKDVPATKITPLTLFHLSKMPP
jgi:leader peptidase (prepilin peptidase)/N-methyltransferase